MKQKQYTYGKAIKSLFNFAGYKIKEMYFTVKEFYVQLECTRKTSRCPQCNARCNRLSETYERSVRDLNLSSKKCTLFFNEARIQCKCGFSGFEVIDFVRPYSRHTIRFEKYIASICRKMTVKDAADTFDLDWKAVKAIDIHYTLEEMCPLSDLDPKRIGVDEIAYRKGHDYLTVVRDLDLEKVIWLGPKRRKETMDCFFTELGPEKSKMISLVVMDMWDPYIGSVKENCPSASIVFDKFHVVKKINEALDKVRRAVFASADKETKLRMKRKRFIILRRKKNLNDKQRESLSDLLQQNEVLYIGYLLKEQISDIFEEICEGRAAERLETWFENVSKSNLKPFMACVKTIKRYFYGIKNYFKYRVTNAPSEGFNNKINVIKRKAYGYRDLDYFALKIYQSMGV